ncbi:lipase family protein [Aestuariivirga sp.]|uniref:lipase family protein n=1 Tax=Aestuariivirga sp. TaxID=2650926 RepID=UPI0035AD785E
MTATRSLIAALAVLASSWAAQAAEVALAPFYQNAATLKAEGPLGTVLAREEVATAIPDAQAWRIVYVSSDVRGKPTLSSALVIAPKGAAPAGGRPILAWAHGTTGTAQSCGPSQVNDPAQDLNEYFLVGGTSWTDFGVPAATQFIAKGYVLVATDYQGLGAGGGAHQYTVAATQGRDVINAVRAAGSMGLSGGAKKAAVYGWSQGGGATIAAASLGDYTAQTGTAFDGVSFVGFVAMAPFDIAVAMPPGASGADGAQKAMATLVSQFGGNVFNFAHLAMNLWAMPQAFPELKLGDVFTDEGVKVLDEVFSKKCMHAGADTISFAYPGTFMSLMKTAPDNAEAWGKAMIEGSVEPKPPVAPVAIYFGDKDTTLPPIMGKLYQAQMCALGANVSRTQLPGEQNHFTTPPMAEQFYVPWIEDRFAGKPLENGCPAQ